MWIWINWEQKEPDLKLIKQKLKQSDWVESCSPMTNILIMVVLFFVAKFERKGTEIFRTWAPLYFLSYLKIILPVSDIWMSFMVTLVF